jgi:putative tricarboxylic transport membrane protein
VTQPKVDEVLGVDLEDDEDTSPAVALERPVETVTLALVLAFSLLLMWDNWRAGARWESTGPQAGYFPFYVSLIMAASCVWGLVKLLRRWHRPDVPFVRREQAKRVLQVFVPTLLYVPVTQWLGLYVASFALIAGFMYFIGHIKAWKAVLTGYLFSAAMFVVFELAFDVIMPKGPLERAFGY